jgi:hypothetical protein
MIVVDGESIVEPESPVSPEIGRIFDQILVVPLKGANQWRVPSRKAVIVAPKRLMMRCPVSRRSGKWVRSGSVVTW